jgi:branched-chain amino acid transport system substrate-binding protein
LPVVASYQAAIAAASEKSKPGFVSLEGYLVGRVVIEALKRVEGEPTREALLNAIAKAPIDLGGLKLTYGPASNQGMEQVFFTVLQADGSFRPVTRLSKSAAQR